MTIETIATNLGVSASTVSRALRDDARISAETRQRVKAEAEKLGYRPNPLISALMAHLRTSRPVEFQSTLAYLDTSTNPRVTNQWASARAHYEGVRQHAARSGYAVDHFWLRDPGITPAHLAHVLYSRGIHGLILHYLPLLDDSKRLPELDLSGFAVTSLGAKLVEPSVHCVCTDHFAITVRALRALAALGYRRIGLAIDEYVDVIVEGRILGAFCGWQTTLPGSQRVPPCIERDFSPRAFAAWYEATRPDAIICIDDRILEWLREMRIAVPETVAVAHLDHRADMGDVAGVRQNHAVAATAAVDLVVSQLNHNERGIPPDPRLVLLDGTWVPGATAPERKPGKAPARRAAAAAKR